MRNSWYVHLWICKWLSSVCMAKLEQQDKKEGDGWSMLKNWVQAVDIVRKTTEDHQWKHAYMSGTFPYFNKLWEIVWMWELFLRNLIDVHVLIDPCSLDSSAHTLGGVITHATGARIKKCLLSETSNWVLKSFFNQLLWYLTDRSLYDSDEKEDLNALISYLQVYHHYSISLKGLLRFFFFLNGKKVFIGGNWF